MISPLVCGLYLRDVFGSFPAARFVPRMGDVNAFGAHAKLVRDLFLIHFLASYLAVCLRRQEVSHRYACWIDVNHVTLGVSVERSSSVKSAGLFPCRAAFYRFSGKIENFFCGVSLWFLRVFS